MIESDYNVSGYDVKSLMSSISSFYESMGTKIEYKANEYLIRGADLWTGNALARSAIEVELFDNQQFLTNTNNAVSLIQDTQFKLSDIQDKLNRMETLAEMAASGEYSAGEVAGFQSEFDVLINQIDKSAISASIQDENMLSYNGTYEVQVDEGLYISIETLDATVTGLGVLDNVDLTSDPQAALNGIQDALSSVQTYSDNVSETQETLEGTYSVLLDHRQDLQQMYASVDSSQSAMQVITELFNLHENTVSALMIAQANENVENALLLLLD